MLASGDKDAVPLVSPNQQPDLNEIEGQLSSLLAAHRDTGLDGPLRSAQDICREALNFVPPGSTFPTDGVDLDVDWGSRLILCGDIQHASYCRNEDLNILYQALECYERVTVPDPLLLRRLALGHGSALVALYDQIPDIKHAEKAIRLLNSVLVDDVVDELSTLALCYLAPIAFKIGWDGASQSAIADDYASRIDDEFRKLQKVYLKVKLLLTRATVAACVSLSKSELKAANDWYKFGLAALDACPPYHFLLAEAHESIASLHDWRYQLVGDVQDLDHAISVADEGLKISSQTSRVRYTLLDVKARSLGSQSEITGDLNLLEEAIDLSRAALKLCPTRHRRYPEHASGLMAALGTHFERSGRIEYLEEITSFANLEFVPKAQWVACNIAEAMLYQARLASMDAASTLLQRAIQLLDARSAYLSNQSEHEKATIDHELGEAYDLQADLGMEIDHDHRLRLARNAVALNQDTFESRMKYKITLITVLINSASRSASIGLLDEAEEIIQNELKKEAPFGHLQASLLALHAELQIIRASTNVMPIDLCQAWQTFETVVTDTSVRPRERLKIATRWATLAEDLDTKSALLAYRHAVHILPEVGYIGEDLVGRVQALRQARDLPPRAASFALGLGDVKQAIELLEQSRGVLWQQALYVRPPLHLLPPHLASQLAEATKTLDSDGTNSASRRQAAEKFQSIVREIRSEPAYEGFLLPRTYDQLVERLPEGYLVWLIPHKTHCDIVIVNSSMRMQPVHSRRADLNLGRLKAITTAFTAVHESALRSVARKTRPSPLPKTDGGSQIHEALLEELWTSLVQSIIRTLDIPSKRRGARPRLWWCPIGPLTFLPLHAAGIYREAEHECVSDYVVSSYLPTVACLINACEASLSDTASHQDTTKVLLVAQPEFQGLPSLPNAQEEAIVVRSIIPDHAILSLEQDSAGGSTALSVLAQLPQASILHLACHATQCKQDPLQSGFDLATGRLTLQELMRVNHPRAQLAYLSTCESAAVDENQPDETINLAATMLFVGFKSVIATMWSMNDIDGPFVAERIYSRVFQDGTLNLDVVPHALDVAIEELRQKGVSASRWATFVHIGK